MVRGRGLKVAAGSALAVIIVAAVAIAEATFPLGHGDIGDGSSTVVGDAMLVRVFIASRTDVDLLIARHFDIAAIGHEGYVDLIISDHRLDELHRLGFATQVMIEDLGSIEVDPEYHTYDETLQLLEQFETDYPEIARLYDIGDSWERRAGYPGHDIWAMKVSDNVAEDEAEPALLYVGEHHAREPLSLEICLYLLHYLLSNYGTNPEVTQWVDETEVWVVPLLNPDGHWVVVEYSQTHPQFDMWRKNTRDNDEDQILYEYLFLVSLFHEGVDLNRNYVYRWGYDNQGSSGYTWDQTYRGPWPGSEPETQALMHLVARENFVAGISYHTYGGWVLYPWGYQIAETPDHAVFADLAEAMASHNGYTPGVSSQLLYQVNGEFADHGYGVHGMMAYTFEMADEFIPPGPEILYHCELNRDASLELFRRLAEPGLQGIVTAEGGIPVEAYLRFVTGSDEVLWFRRTDPLTGFYAKLLEPGTYRVTAIAPNYAPATYPNIIVGSGGATIFDIEVSGVSYVTLELSPEASVVPQGGELGLSAVLVNTTAEHHSYLGETGVGLPGGAPYVGNPIVGPVSFTIAPHDTFETFFVHSIPENAPIGVYRYEGIVRTDDEVVIAKDAFTFEVVAP